MSIKRVYLINLNELRVFCINNYRIPTVAKTCKVYYVVKLLFTMNKMLLTQIYSLLYTFWVFERDHFDFVRRPYNDGINLLDEH